MDEKIIERLEQLSVQEIHDVAKQFTLMAHFSETTGKNEEAISYYKASIGCFVAMLQKLNIKTT